MSNYTLLEDRFEHKAGTIVYRFQGHDYGCSSDDTRITGLTHASMTLNADRTGPFFTVPITLLKELTP